MADESGGFNWNSVGQTAANALGGMGMGLLGDALGNIGSRKRLRRQVSASKELADYNHNLAKKMWDETNIGAQIKHWKDAGVNPSAMLAKGGGAPGQTTVAPGSASMPDNNNSTMQGMSMMLQNQNMQAQKENIEASTEKTKAETDSIRGVQTDSARQQISESEARELLITTERELKGLDWSVNLATMEARIGEIVAKSNLALANSKVATSTVGDQIRKVKEEAIGEGLENALKRNNIKIGYLDMKFIIRKISESQSYQNIAEDENKISRDKFNLDKELRERGMDLQERQQVIDAVFGIISAASKGAVPPPTTISRSEVTDHADGTRTERNVRERRQQGGRRR